MKRVVITGLGGITPLGNTITKTWQNLVNGVSGASSITHFDTSNSLTKIACEVKGFDPLDFLDKKDINKLDLVSQYSLIACNEAISESKLLLTSIDKARVGVIWGTGNGGATTYENTLKELQTGASKKVSPYFVPKILLDTSSGIISIKHGLRGVNYTTVSACASASTAIADAFNYIRWGKADAIITGGADAPICASLIAGFNSLKALSTKNDSPLTASRPFDAARDGFVMGEGSVAFVVESLDTALARNANILAEIVGTGINADAYHMTAGHPDGQGAIACIRLALEEAGIDFEQLDYLNAHATSTPVGDLAESYALKNLSSNKKSPWIGATKSMTGHLMGAAGALEAAICVLAVQQNTIPPTINLDSLDSKIDAHLRIVGKNAIKNEVVEYALSNNFGFGGHNGAIIFKKFT